MSGIDLTLTLNIDLDLLRQQKDALVSIIDMSGEEDEAIVEACEGLLSLIDGIQDTAADVLDPGLVFGGADWVIVDPQDGIVDRYYTRDEALDDMTEEMMERGFAILHRPDPGPL